MECNGCQASTGYPLNKYYSKKEAIESWNKRKKEISKRKMESYKRAEEVCQEFRYQMVMACREDWNSVCDYLFRWMKVTGDKIKFKRPKDKK